jgi:hypothetical protein
VHLLADIFSILPLELRTVDEHTQSLDVEALLATPSATQTLALLGPLAVAANGDIEHGINGLTVGAGGRRSDLVEQEVSALAQLLHVHRRSRRPFAVRRHALRDDMQRGIVICSEDKIE